MGYGSSPRMWGTLDTADSALDRLRFIPTHVGNTNLYVPTCSLSPVHPHACGEHHTIHVVFLRHPGSSPRMWGTPYAPGPTPLNYRFIPTHVGNTIRQKVITRIRSVHPHACGEHALPSFLTLRACGSSPRMWGTQIPSVCKIA